MKTALLLFALLPAMTPFQSPSAPSPIHEFITANGGRLLEGGKPFRFISFNIPNLTYTEDNMQFEETNIFRLPTTFELEDAFLTIEQVGGRVARTYVLSVRKTNDPPSMPRHIVGPDRLDETAMVMLDQALESANRHGVRLIIPFIDHASWWGGIAEFAGFRGKSHNEFYTDPQVREDFKRILGLVIQRVNTKTGVRYRDDKAILAWELGNELRAPKEWVREMAVHIKELDTNHLVAESYFTDPENPGVDIVQDHLYQGDPVKMIDAIHASLKRSAGRKVYMVGEFGFVSTEGMRAVIDAIIREPAVAGGLIWSLRFHDQDGGFYWHHEPWGSDFFKAYHWPGGPAGQPYDETRLMRMVREKAFEIQGCTAPPLNKPTPPESLSVSDGGLVNWLGCAGAASYNLQRSDEPASGWQTVASQLTDDAAQYHPLAVDEFAAPGKSYYYRLLASNEAGTSDPSPTVGPVKIRCRTLVDELSNLSHSYRKSGKLELRTNDARNYKEDCHRLWGAPGAWIGYHLPGRILAARIYTFGEQGEPNLDFFAGTEPKAGEQIEAKAKDFYAGKDMYNFRWPRLYIIPVLPKASTDLVIQFQKETQIARIEIEYE